MKDGKIIRRENVCYTLIDTDKPGTVAAVDGRTYTRDANGTLRRTDKKRQRKA